MTAETTSDLDLIRQVREGDNAGYQMLYERHSSAARNLARHLARDPNVADDLVSEAFTKVLQAIRGNGGPEHAFRTYLLTTLRNTAYEHGRRDKRITFVDDYTVFEQGETVADSASLAPERTLITEAYRLLPERWRMVLWYTEVEGYQPAAVAPLMGMTPNGVAALSYRAREGLRQAYLRAHVTTVHADMCRASVDRLGAWTRNALSRRERAQLELHLDDCERCRALAAELTEINTALPALVAVAVLGVAGAGYLATAPAASAAGAIAGTAGAAGAAAGGASKSAGTHLVGASLSGLAVAVTTAIGLSATGAQPAIAVADDEPANVRITPDVPSATPAPPPLSEPSPTDPPRVSTRRPSIATHPSKSALSPQVPPQTSEQSAPPTTTTPPTTTPPTTTPPITTPKPPPYKWNFAAATERKPIKWVKLTITVPGDANKPTPVVVEITPPKGSIVKSKDCQRNGDTWRCTGKAGGGQGMTVELEILTWPGVSSTAEVKLTAEDQVVTRSVPLPAWPPWPPWPA
nr:sigma-70 family RNA polymerase sigma factor [Kibdelosporangium sp. MJ126-NF4]CEL15317.1 sigma-70 region 2 domain protein [Kibdelosporangium sp. MJ126-NF4]CTQ95641.1 sigma-70 region 2 domain protein [Kibdelosporangium sp. MJ126-NF4]